MGVINQARRKVYWHRRMVGPVCLFVLLGGGGGTHFCQNHESTPASSENLAGGGGGGGSCTFFACRARNSTLFYLCIAGTGAPACKLHWAQCAPAPPPPPLLVIIRLWVLALKLLEVGWLTQYTWPPLCQAYHVPQ